MSDKTNDPKPPSEPASQAPVAAVEDDSDPGYEDLDGTPSPTVMFARRIHILIICNRYTRPVQPIRL